MLSNGGMRASDQNRKATAEVLREAYVAGRLDLGEFSARVGAEYSARTWAELRNLTDDLPSRPGTSYPRPPAAGAWTGDEADAWSADEAHPAPGRPPVPVFLIALACPGLAGAAWWPAALIPLIILSLPALAAAGWSARRAAQPLPQHSRSRPTAPADAASSTPARGQCWPQRTSRPPSRRHR